MSSAGYDLMLELVADNPTLEGEDLVKMATDDDLDDDDTRQWLEDAEATGDVLEFNGKYCVVRRGEYSIGEFDHPV